MSSKLTTAREYYTCATRLMLDGKPFTPVPGQKYRVSVEVKGQCLELECVGAHIPLVSTEFGATEHDLLVKRKTTVDELPADITISIYNVIKSGHVVSLLQP